MRNSSGLMLPLWSTSISSNSLRSHIKAHKDTYITLITKRAATKVRVGTHAFRAPCLYVVALMPNSSRKASAGGKGKTLEDARAHQNRL